MSTKPHPLASDPLTFLAFEKIRRVGTARADGGFIAHEGSQHRLTVHTLCTIQTTHVVINAISGPALGQKTAMAIVSIDETGYVGGPGGLELVLPALFDGIEVHGPGPSTFEYRVLSHLPIPPLFCASGHDRK